MRVLVCEPSSGSRQLHYAALTARAASQVATEVVLGLSRATAGSDGYGQFIRQFDARTVVRSDVDAPQRRSESKLHSRVVNRVAHWTFLQHYIREVKPDHVILPSGDRVANALALLPKAFSRGAQLEVVLHTSVLGRPIAGESLEGRFRRILIPRAPSVVRYHFTDWTQYVEARLQNPVWARKFRLLPEPIQVFDLMTRYEARHLLNLPAAGRIALAISPEPLTGLDRLVQLCGSDRMPADYSLVIAGRVDPSVERYIAERLAPLCAHGRVIFLHNGNDEPDLHRAISAADLVIGRLKAAGGLSARCLRAVAANRRFFAAANPWLDKMANELRAGDTFDGAKAGDMERAFGRALERTAEPIDPEVVRRIRQFHSPERFMAAISDRLRTRAGLKPVSDLTWDWVREAADRPSSSHVA